MSDSKIELDELIINSRPLKRVGAPVGNKNAQKTKNKDDSVKVKRKKTKATSGGNSREYWIGRLKRDAPLHLVLLEAGEYKSVSEAVTKSGLKKKPLSRPERMFKDVHQLGISDLEHLNYLTKTRIKALQRKCTPHKIAMALHEKFSQEGKNIVYVFYNDDTNRYIYMSQGKKLINYSKKIIDKFEDKKNTFIFDDVKLPINENSNIGNALLFSFILYVTDKMSENDYEYFVENNNLPRIHRIIMPYKKEDIWGSLLNPKMLIFEDYNEERRRYKIKRQYIDAIQDFLDKG